MAALSRGYKPRIYSINKLSGKSVPTNGRGTFLPGIVLFLKNTIFSETLNLCTTVVKSFQACFRAFVVEQNDVSVTAYANF